jgi:hypothetical protein
MPSPVAQIPSPIDVTSPFNAPSSEILVPGPPSLAPSPDIPSPLFGSPSDGVSSSPEVVLTPSPSSLVIASPPVLNCGNGTSPSADSWICSGGVWTLIGSMVVPTNANVSFSTETEVVGSLTINTNASVVISSNLNISGDFVVGSSSQLSLGQNASVKIEGSLTLTSGSTLNVKSNSNSNDPPVTVSDCLRADGALLNSDASGISNFERTYTVMSYNCKNGTFAAISVADVSDECQMAVTDEAQSKLTVSFQIDKTKCPGTYFY